VVSNGGHLGKLPLVHGAESLAHRQDALRGAASGRGAESAKHGNVRGVVSVVGGGRTKLTLTLARQQPQSPGQVLSMEEEGEITGGTGGEPGGNRGKPGENGGGFTGGLNAAVEFFPDTEEIIGCDRIITRLNKDIVRGRWRISSSINSSSINSSSINSSSINSSSSSSSRRW